MDIEWKINERKNMRMLLNILDCGDQAWETVLWELVEVIKYYNKTFKDLKIKVLSKSPVLNLIQYMLRYCHFHGIVLGFLFIQFYGWKKVWFEMLSNNVT